MHAFDFRRPATIEEALTLLANGEAQALAGGQTLIPTLKQRLAMPEVLVSLGGIDELRGLEIDAGRMSIGAGVTHGEIARAAAGRFAGLATLAGKIGDPAVRNRGTIGGSVANNDPSACYPAAALATGATIRTTDSAFVAEDFFLGLFTTALGEGQLVTRVDFPLPKASAYVKFEQPASRFPLVGVFVARFADRVGVGVTGASEEGAFRWREAEEVLSDTFEPEAVAGLAPDAEGMIGDLHGDPDYRAHLVGLMTRRAVAAAA